MLLGHGLRFVLSITNDTSPHRPSILTLIYTILMVNTDAYAWLSN